MSGNLFETGAVFSLLDRFSEPLAKLTGGLDRSIEQSAALQAELDKLGLHGLATRSTAELEKMTGATSASTKEMTAAFGKLEAGALANLDGIGGASGRLWGAMTTGNTEMVAAILGNTGNMRQGVTEQMDLLKGNMAGLWSGMVEGADGASTAVLAAMGQIGGAIDGPLAAVRALVAETREAAAQVAALSEASAGGAAAAAVGGASIPGMGGGGRGVGRARHVAVVVRTSGVSEPRSPAGTHQSRADPVSRRPASSATALSKRPKCETKSIGC